MQTLRQHLSAGGLQGDTSGTATERLTMALGRLEQRIELANARVLSAASIS